MTPERATLLVVALAVQAGYAESTDPDGIVEEIVVTGDLDSLPGDEIRTVFGFGKSLLDTPRSVSTVSDEMMERFIVRDIDELIALAPGSFTQSFFGVAGTLDLRGTTGESYFRGMRRLENAGNYPTPIAASSRIDIVRGPASPIHGPAKVGGYLNFHPKSARIEETGEFIASATGSVGVDLGSWDRRVVTAEIGGPGDFLGEDFGYWLYAEVEDSGSYYRNSPTEQTILQASFDLNAGGAQLQFGGMVHDYDGNEIGGWNRLTQDLVDHGVYVTGSPRPLDVDGDGYISHQEFDVDGDGYTDLNPFAAGLVPGGSAGLDVSGPFPGACRIGTTTVFGCSPDLLRLQTSGTARLRGDQVLVDAEDVIRHEMTTLYFDATLGTDGGWEWRNQLFYEAYDHVSEVTYGFSDFHDASAIENKLVLAKAFQRGTANVGLQVSPSFRRTDFHYGNDYTNEYFDRRDLTRPASSLDRRLLATRIDDDYTEYYIGRYVDLGLAVLADVQWRRLGVMAGARYDRIDLRSRQPLDKLLLPSANNLCPDSSCVEEQAADATGGLSWTLSVSYAVPLGLVPYATLSRQSTVIAGQGAEITVANIASGQAFDESSLREAGIKGSLKDGALYFAVAGYEQERTDYSAQNVVTNQATRTTGLEAETRWLATDRLLMTLAYSTIEVINLNTLQSGGRFSFIGAADVPGIDPAALYGGALGGIVVREGAGGARRAGIPERIISITGTYDFGYGVAASASVVDVARTTSGFSGSVELPAYRLVNVGVVVEADRWRGAATAKNLTDERYFRANFPNLFGSVVVLPELPRHYALRIQYKW
ncbi:MAG: TonB-dependent receptor [Gammaproteobacteria bacterium]|nr:TonB-dependent receptor [Gammaproteobacteria bacterium]MDE0444773.1 TonB-dependent receptor [Gammaproteobacteria bacterium]